MLLVRPSRDRFPVVPLDVSVTYSFRPFHGPGVDSDPSENEYQEYFQEVKAAGEWGWPPQHLHVPNIMEIWEPKPPGTLWATPGLLRDSFNFIIIIIIIIMSVNYYCLPAVVRKRVDNVNWRVIFKLEIISVGCDLLEGLCFRYNIFGNVAGWWNKWWCLWGHLALRTCTYGKPLMAIVVISKGRGGVSDEHLDKWRLRNETDGSSEIKQKLQHAPRLWKPLKTRGSSLCIIAYWKTRNKNHHPFW
jgi:hypothetical protein